MANEKIKTEELEDEDMNKASGGNYTFVDPSKKPKKCANPLCSAELPYGYPGKYCKKCLTDAGEDNTTPIGRPAPYQPR